VEKTASQGDDRILAKKRQRPSIRLSGGRARCPTTSTVFGIYQRYIIRFTNNMGRRDMEAKVCGRRKPWWLCGVAVVIAAAGCAEPEPIGLSGALSETGKYEGQGKQLIWGAEAIVAWVNDELGGVEVDGKMHELVFEHDDDASDSANVETLVNGYCDDESVHFILGPYSSGLTEVAAGIADGCDKILLAAGGASNSLAEQDRDTFVMIYSPASLYQTGFLDMVAVADSNNLDIAYLYEDGLFAKSVRDATIAAAEAAGHSTVFNEVYPVGADDLDSTLIGHVATIAGLAPDLVIGGGHYSDGLAVAQLFAAATPPVEPHACSLLVAPADPDFYLEVAPCDSCVYADHPAEGLTAPAQWEARAAFTPDFGPTAGEFLTLFEAEADPGTAPAYQGASGAAAVLTLVAAIEEADSFETDDVRAALGNLQLTTFYGDFDIDATGLQTGHEMVQLQWQDGSLELVSPTAVETSSFVYPAP
jgi:branched-chain amino acid transport system substrate-binding protein